MSEELLNIAKELSEKPTTELALQFMELTADNIIKGKEIDRLKSTNKVLLEELTKDKEELKNKDNIIDELEKWLEENKKISQAHENVLGVNISNLVLDKLKELKENNK